MSLRLGRLVLLHSTMPSSETPPPTCSTTLPGKVAGPRGTQWRFAASQAHGRSAEIHAARKDAASAPGAWSGAPREPEQNALHGGRASLAGTRGTGVLDPGARGAHRLLSCLSGI